MSNGREKCPDCKGDPKGVLLFNNYVPCNACAPLSEGDIVAPVGDFILHSGSRRYADAVVVRVEPFALVSRGTDMVWSCTVGPEDFTVTGKASAELLEACRRRL